MKKYIPVWKEVLRTNFTRIEPLVEFLQLERDIAVNRPGFILNLPYRLAEKIEKGNPKDPLFLQFVPTESETRDQTGFSLQPVEDFNFQCTDRMLQKYEGRVLLVLTGACAMHCRYCFRQNFDYPAKERFFDRELTAIEQDATIREVILSGGDPLSLGDEILEPVLKRLDAIPHVQSIRFHSRFPIGIPERLDDSFLEMLKHLQTQVWFVIHANHPRELDQDVIHALTRLRRIGIPVLNQAVLLRGVNDSTGVQVELSRKLVDHGFIPYYLHQLDRVQGAAHFEVSVEEGRRIVAEMAKHLPGYAVPRYVQEIPFEHHKTPL